MLGEVVVNADAEKTALLFQFPNAKDISVDDLSIALREPQQDNSCNSNQTSPTHSDEGSGSPSPVVELLEPKRRADPKKRELVFKHPKAADIHYYFLEMVLSTAIQEDGLTPALIQCITAHEKYLDMPEYKIWEFVHEAGERMLKMPDQSPACLMCSQLLQKLELHPSLKQVPEGAPTANVQAPVTRRPSGIPGAGIGRGGLPT